MYLDYKIYSEIVNTKYPVDKGETTIMFFHIGIIKYNNRVDSYLLLRKYFQVLRVFSNI